MGDFAYPPVNFETHPDQYVHWDLEVDGSVAKLTMHIKEDRPMWDGLYDLKLNSYDLAVDIELHDVVNRLRFEHPEVRCVVLTGAYDKIFCAGANIRFLGNAPHAFKVNFCKYTNETRCGIEDAVDESGIVFMAALNGTASGGGYELALACEEIYLIDDGNAAVALPEVPLLGVLPGTGGLTRLTDKRKIRRDISDVFCTKAEGFRARDAKKYNFVDGSFPRSKWADGIAARASEIVSEQDAKFPNRKGAGVALPALSRTDTDDGWSYTAVDVTLDGRVANIMLKGPESAPERSAETWSLRAFRELEDALLRLRVNHLEIGLINLRTEEMRQVLAQTFILDGRLHDCSSRDQALPAPVSASSRQHGQVHRLGETGHCFIGALRDGAQRRPHLHVHGRRRREHHPAVRQQRVFPMANGMTRLQARFQRARRCRSCRGNEPIDADEADDMARDASLDDIDWDDEVRIAIEGVSMTQTPSPA